jgi:TPR repeat protein
MNWIRHAVLASVVVALYFDSVEAGTAEAQAKLDRGDVAGALHELKVPLQTNDPRAQFQMGMIGAGHNNDRAARDWWERSAAAGCADAMTALGYFSLGGRAGQRDAKQAADWFRRGAQGGSAQGCLNSPDCT